MGESQVQFFKELLEARHSELVMRLENAKASIATIEHFADEADRATYEADRAQEFRMIERDRVALNETRMALARIADESYGYCEATGEEIGHARLILFPSTLYCVEAMQKQELNQKHLRRA